MPTVERLDLFPKVNQAPRPPTDADTPDFERFTLSPGSTEIRLENLKPIPQCSSYCVSQRSRRDSNMSASFGPRNTTRNGRVRTWYAVRGRLTV